MALLYYICPIVGSGTKQDPWEATIHSTGAPYAAFIAHNANGSPRFNWALCLVGGNNHAAIQLDTNKKAFPQVPLDTQLADIDATVRSNWQTVLTNHGVDLSGITLQSTVRQVGRRVAQRLDAVFDFDRCFLLDA